MRRTWRDPEWRSGCLRGLLLLVVAVICWFVVIALIYLLI